MDKLLETIKIVNGNVLFLAFHNQRLNQTRQALFHTQDDIDLHHFIQAPSKKGIYKCRVIYSQRIETLEYYSYQEKTFNSFKIIADDNITYSFKYLNREHLNRLVRLKEPADDILIVKQGFITDTSIANVAFWYQDKWLTPATPLLKGTTRERLLTEKQIQATEIRLTDVKDFSKMAIMNALIGFYVIEDFKLIF